MNSARTTNVDITKETATDQIEFRATYPHSREVVWRAITDPQRIAQWFTQMDIRAEVGTPYKLIHEGQVAVTGRILEVVAPELFRYTWIVNGTTAETVVSWLLIERSGGRTTELVLTHHGLLAYGDSALAMLSNFSKGWESCVVKLGEHLGEAS